MYTQMYMTTLSWLFKKAYAKSDIREPERERERTRETNVP